MIVAAGERGEETLIETGIDKEESHGFGCMRAEGKKVMINTGEEKRGQL
jgi:hypothetical protein